MSAYTDKLQEWVDSVKMCEEAGIEPCYKHNGVLHNNLVPIFVGDNLSYFTFPIAVVEGKPVFVGDELYCLISNHQFKVKGLCNNGVAFEYTTRYQNRTGVTKDCVSWNPPKPKTVMVELLIEDAEFYAKPDGYTNLATACRKALEGMK